MSVTFEELDRAAQELIDLLPDARSRDVQFEVLKLAEECGEVVECFTKSKKTKQDLAEELADVLIVVALLARKTGIDLSEAHLLKHPKRIDKIVNRFHGGSRPNG